LQPRLTCPVNRFQPNSLSQSFPIKLQPHAPTVLFFIVTFKYPVYPFDLWKPFTGIWFFVIVTEGSEDSHRAGITFGLCITNWLNQLQGSQLSHSPREKWWVKAYYMPHINYCAMRAPWTRWTKNIWWNVNHETICAARKMAPNVGVQFLSKIHVSFPCLTVSVCVIWILLISREL